MPNTKDDYVYLCITKDQLVKGFYSVQEMKDYGFSKEDKKVTAEAYCSNGCYARVVAGDIVLGVEKGNEELQKLLEQMQSIKSQIGSTDYQVIKVARRVLAAEIEKDYPGAYQSYKDQISEFNKLEEKVEKA